MVKEEKKIPDSLLQKQIDYWMEGHASDTKTTQSILENTDRYGAALFFLHLSLEKLLKALFTKKNGIYAPLTHNLLSLAERCDVPVTKEYEAWLAEINQFNMVTRYPSEKSDFYRKATKEFAEIHVARGKKLTQWILENFKK